MRVTSNQLITVPFGNTSPVSTGRLNRLSLIVQNRSAGNVYLTFGIPASNLNGFIDGFEIPPNGSFFIDRNCPLEPVFLRPDSISGSVVQFIEIYGEEV